MAVSKFSPVCSSRGCSGDVRRFFPVFRGPAFFLSGIDGRVGRSVVWSVRGAMDSRCRFVLSFVAGQSSTLAWGGRVWAGSVAILLTAFYRYCRRHDARQRVTVIISVRGCRRWDAFGPLCKDGPQFHPRIVIGWGKNPIKAYAAAVLRDPRVLRCVNGRCVLRVFGANSEFFPQPPPFAWVVWCDWIPIALRFHRIRTRNLLQRY